MLAELMQQLKHVFLIWYASFIFFSSSKIASAKKGNNPHVLMLSPPLNMDPKWFKDSTAYTIAKVPIFSLRF